MSESLGSEIRQLTIFAAVQDAPFTELMRAAYVQNFPPHVELITEGEPSDFLHIVLSGSVELFSAWQGRETSLATVRPVSTFILAATMRDAPYLMSARTQQKSRIALIPSQDIRRTFGQDAEFARAIVEELADCYRGVVRTVKDLKLRNSLERLANYLLREQRRQAGAARFDLPFEKRRLASLLGMTPENLSRAFRALGPYGITVEGTRITIIDQADLERFAKPDLLIDDPRT